MNPNVALCFAGSPKDRCDKKGFIWVEKKKSSCINQCATAMSTGLSQQCLLSAEVPTTPLYVSIHRETQRDDVVPQAEDRIHHEGWKFGVSP